jgi:hypothetical protein
MAFDHLLQTSLIARLQNAKKEADLLFRDESQTVSELKLLEQQVLCLEVANLRPPTLLSFQVLLRHPDSDSKHGGYFASGQATHAASCSQDAAAVAESKGGEGACGGCGFPLDLFRFQREELQPIADTVDLDDSAMLQTLRVSAAKAVMAQQQLELPPSGHVLRLSFLDDELQPFCVLRNKALRLKELMRKRRKHHPQMKLDASRPLSEAYNRPVCLFAEWVSRDLETQNTPSCLLVHVTERHSLALDIQEPAAAELESKNSAETKQKHTKAAVVAVTGANKPPITAMLNKDMHDSLDKVKGFLLANYFPQMEEVENMELAIYDKHRFTWQILYQHAPKGKNRSRKKKGRKRRNRVQRKKTWGVLKQLKDHEAFAVYDKRALGDLGEFGQRDPKTKKAAPCRYFTPFDVLMADTDLHPHYNLSCSIALTVTVSSDPSKKKKAVSEPVLYIDGGEWDSSDEDDSSD